MRVWLMAVLVVLTLPASAAEIRVMAAGSLKDPFTAIFADFSKQYGVGFSPVWGPSGLLRERLQGGESFDVFASAALPHAQALTDAGVSGPSVMFARNTLCVLAGADRPYATGNLVETLLKPEVRIGTSTPGADPSGDYAWELFHKLDAAKPGAFETLSKKAQQLVGGPTNSAPVNGRSQILIALDDNQVDLFISYCSSAQQIVRESAKYNYGDQSLRYGYPLASWIVEQSTDAAQRIVTLQTEDGFSVCLSVPREQQSPLGEALMAQPKSAPVLLMN
jgi:molybdate transport system substrate-binding protein